jgi:hypothetical protein
VQTGAGWSSTQSLLECQRVDLQLKLIWLDTRFFDRCAYLVGLVIHNHKIAAVFKPEIDLSAEDEVLDREDKVVFVPLLLCRGRSSAKAISQVACFGIG